MSEPEAAAEEPAAKPKKGGSPLLLVILLVNTIGLFGIGAYVMFFLPKGGGPALTPEQMAAQHDAKAQGGAAAEAGEGDRHGGGKSGDKAGPMVELGTLVVNLREPSGEHFLKTRLTLELDAEPTKAEVEGRLSQIRYQLNMLLAGQRIADVQGPEKMEALRQTMTRRANAVLGSGKIVGVWPEEWIVQ